MRHIDDTILDFIRENPTLSTKALCKIFRYGTTQMDKIRDRVLGDSRAKSRGRGVKGESLNIDDPLHEVVRIIIEGMTPKDRQRFDKWVEKKVEEKMEELELKRNLK